MGGGKGGRSKVGRGGGISDSRAPQIITRPAEVCDQSSKSLHMCVCVSVCECVCGLVVVCTFSLFSGLSVSCVPAASLRKHKRKRKSS